MRGKFLTLASATGLGLLALMGMQGTAQAHEGYRHSYFRYFHGDRGRDHGRGHFHHYRDHDRR
jgi:hypothetical protein